MSAGTARRIKSPEWGGVAREAGVAPTARRVGRRGAWHRAGCRPWSPDPAGVRWGYSARAGSRVPPWSRRALAPQPLVGPDLPSPAPDGSGDMSARRVRRNKARSAAKAELRVARPSKRSSPRRGATEVCTWRPDLPSPVPRVRSFRRLSSRSSAALHSGLYSDAPFGCLDRQLRAADSGLCHFTAPKRAKSLSALWTTPS